MSNKNTLNWNNYHTHTWRCKHATGDVDDFAQHAIELGMTRLGMSDHAHLPWEVDAPSHMPETAIAGYVRACRQADEKYPELKVLCGMECDFEPEDVNYFKEVYLGQYNVDYLSGSVHCYYPDQNKMDCFQHQYWDASHFRIYTDLYIKAMESGLFSFMNHPDLFGETIGTSDPAPGWTDNCTAAAKEILAAAADIHIPLEINVAGVGKTNRYHLTEILYPRWQFWEIASDYDIDVIVNTDCHAVEDLDANVAYGFELVRRYGLHRVEI